MKRMGMGITLAAMAALGASPAAATEPGGAEQLRRLDIMLEVGAQRCAGGPQDYARDYRRFAAAHRRELKQAQAELRRDLAVRHGSRGAGQALERQGTAIANSYGQGHPWLDCAQLGLVARNLAQVLGRATLEEAADQLTGPSAGARMASAR